MTEKNNSKIKIDYKDHWFWGTVIENKAITESIVMRSSTGTVRTIKATHNLNTKS